MTRGVNVREIAVGALVEILEKDKMSHQVLGAVLEKYQYLEKQERAFLSRTVEGTLEKLLELDYIMGQFSKTPVSKMKPFIRNLLRMSLYHLFYMDSVPERAVVSEAVKLAERKGFHGLKGFVNGLLRGIARNKDHIGWPEDELSRLEVRASIPKWILEEWLAMYDNTVVEEMIKGISKKRPLTIRCNRRKIGPEALKARLKAEGVEAALHPYLPYALEISGFDYLGKLKSFQEGEFQVQDISSMLAADLGARFHPGFALDVCSAPGGKALHLAEAIGEGCLVEARDINGYKVSLMEENRARLGAANLVTRIWDAAVLDETMIEKADLLLADLPCSGLGVIGKKRDICYKTTKEDVESLAELQRKILSVVWQYVRKGGVLLYSTCTVTRQENLENLRWFMENHPFEPIDIQPYFADCLQEDSMKKGYLQLLPGVHRSDGFFLSALRRR